MNCGIGRFYHGGFNAEFSQPLQIAEHQVMGFVSVRKDSKLIIDFSRPIYADGYVNPVTAEYFHAFGGNGNAVGNDKKLWNGF